MSAPPPLDRVHVWTISTAEAGTPDRLDHYRALLTADEIARGNRFLQEADRVRFVVARALVRTMLSRYVPVPPHTWRLRIEQYGKPEVANLPASAPDLRFNLSHTEGLVRLRRHRRARDRRGR